LLATQILPVILCGGTGSRLWPLSRSTFPKQFLALPHRDLNESLLQQTIHRMLSINHKGIRLDNPLIVTNEDHRFLVVDQLSELSSSIQNLAATLVLEPSGKNTAPALTLAALFAQEDGSDPILVVSPADQIIGDLAAFQKALKNCIEIAQEGSISILGVRPTEPATGYGYIKAGGISSSNQGRIVDRFVEKPDAATAEKYLNEGDFFWNSGMLVLKASVWLAAIQKYRPDILFPTQLSWQAKVIDIVNEVEFIRPNKDLFNVIPSESIDCAVLEKCPDPKERADFSIKMVELNAGWNDLGAWDSVWQAGQPDAFGNVTKGDTLLINSKNSLIYAGSRLVGSVGIKNLIIVETPDAVLVADRDSSQDIKSIVTKLSQQKREEENLHRKVYRPWGWYDTVDYGERFKVKRIMVKPGASLSLQMHHHRAEHWIVVQGTAEVTNGDSVTILEENQSTFIPRGQTHRLKNIGIKALEVIEVQSGGYLGEDDIVRVEDGYGRSGH